MQIIKALNLEKNFINNKAIKSIDFSISSGKITGLVGPDGAGKTTLIRMLTGLLKPSFGKLEVLGYQMPNTTSEFLQQIEILLKLFATMKNRQTFLNYN